MEKESLLSEIDFGEVFETLETPEDILANQSGVFSNQSSKKESNDELEIELDDKLDVNKDSKDEPLKKVKSKKEEVITEKENPPSQDKDTSNSNSIALDFARFVNEKGVFSSYDEDEFSKFVEENGDEAGLEYLFSREVESRVGEIKKTYESDFVEYIELKDSGVDSDIAKQLISSKIKFDSLTKEQLEADENLRKSVLFQDYKNTTQLSDEKISKLIQKSIDTGTDIEEAIEALESVKKFNAERIKAEKQRVIDEENAAKDNMDKLIKAYKDTIYSANEVLGQKINKQTQTKIEQFILTKGYKDANNNQVDGITAWISKDPIGARIKLAYAIMTGMLDGDFRKIESKVKSDAVSKIHEKLQATKNGLDGNPNTGGEKSSTFNALKNTFGNL